MESLDTLFAEALSIESRKRRGQGSVKRLREIGNVIRTSYLDPANWRDTRVVLVLHNDPGIGSLGYFQESVHRRTSARKLRRLEHDPFGHYEVEIVSGGSWSGPQRPRVIDPPTAGELAHIRAAWAPKLWRPAWKHLGKDRRQGPLKFSQAKVDSLLNDLVA